MESKVQKAKKNADIAEENDGVTAEKIKFPLYVFPETMKTVDILYKSDNCSSRTEFMEKAIRFYCGYLLQNKPELVDYLAPQIATLTEGIVKGTEQRLSRALFKVAVELGAISHYNVPLVKTQMKKIIVTAKTLYSHPKNVSKIYAALHTDLAW